MLIGIQEMQKSPIPGLKSPLIGICKIYVYSLAKGRAFSSRRERHVAADCAKFAATFLFF